MEEEIKAEFNKNGFTLDEEQEILQKCECSFSFPFLPSNLVRILPQLVPFLIFFDPLRSYILHSVQAQSFQPRFELGPFLYQQVQGFFQPMSDRFSTVPPKTNWQYRAFQLSLLRHLASHPTSMFWERSQPQGWHCVTKFMGTLQAQHPVWVFHENWWKNGTKLDDLRCLVYGFI